MSSTRTVPVKIFTWKKEKQCSPKATKFFLNFNDALSKQQTYTSSEKFHLEEGETMLAQGNEIFLNFNFNDALVSSTRTLPVKIFTWKKEKPCSPGARKIFCAPGEHGLSFFQVKCYTGSVRVLLTSASLKLNLFSNIN